MTLIGTFQTCQSQRIEGIAKAQCFWSAINFLDHVGPQGRGHSIGAIILNREMVHFAADDLKERRQLPILASTVKIEQSSIAEASTKSGAAHAIN
jgi:hypothetical protein